MVKSRWSRVSGMPLVALAAALTLAACDNDDRISSDDDVDNEAVVQDQDYALNDTDALDQGAAGQAEMQQGIDNPYDLTGQTIQSADGETLGEVTQLVTDDATTVYAVIEMNGAEQTPPSSGSMVVDIDDINRRNDQFILMSQDVNLEPYNPEIYTPLGTREEETGAAGTGEADTVDPVIQ